MNAIRKQARRILSASLFFVFLTACAAQATPTAPPTSTRTPRPSATESAPQATSTPQPRTEIETYTVAEGDTVSSIAAVFNLEPETVLWANYELLNDIPDFLFPGMRLTILPIDGVYHQVGGGDNITNIAAFFGADAQAIIDWPGNEIDAANPVIFPGQWLVVPSGNPGPRRRLMPNLARTAMAVDFSEYGSGACPQNVTGGAEGDGIFAWPLASHELRGEGFWSAHMAADLAAEADEPVLAADDGVVTFSGWSNFGYGNEIMLYAGLQEASALCGASVAQGEIIGIAGAIGHPAGVFIHFEIRRGAETLDPLSLLP
jgi:hypothetical protein